MWLTVALIRWIAFETLDSILLRFVRRSICIVPLSPSPAIRSSIKCCGLTISWPVEYMSICSPHTTRIRMQCLMISLSVRQSVPSSRSAMFYQRLFMRILYCLHSDCNYLGQYSYIVSRLLRTSSQYSQQSALRDNVYKKVTKLDVKSRWCILKPLSLKSVIYFWSTVSW